jgi:hypothetical protein
MTKAADMMGLGFSWPQAQNLGYTNIAITAAGTTSADATACDAQNSVFVMTATGSDGIRMSTSVPLLRPILVVNTSGSTGKVYPFTGGAFNGGSTDAGISVATQKAVLIMRISTNVWLIMLGG